MERPDYICCIKASNGESLCGRNLSHEWAFESREHADLTVAAGSRLETCQSCLAILVGE